MEFNTVIFRALLVIFILSSGVEGSCTIIQPEGCRCASPTGTLDSYIVKCQSNGFTSMPPQKNFTLSEGYIIGNFSYNEISQIPNFYFLQAQTYKELDFHSNRISGFSNFTFSGLTGILEVLDLSKNRLSSIDPTSLEGLYRLTELDMSENSISSICGVSMKFMVTLRLSGNAIKILSGECFRSATSIKYLDLSRNEISSIHDEAFINARDLADLNLDNNRLSKIGTGLDSLRQSTTLKRLSLRGNGISNLDDMCEYMWNTIEYLDFGHNNLRRISEYCFRRYASASGTQGPFELVFEHNLLEAITNRELNGLENRLKVLRLNDNKITTIHVWTFKSMTKLTKLSLASNFLTKLPFLEQWTDSVLEELDLSNNHLTSLSSEVFKELTSLKTLNLDGNFLFYLEPNTFTGMTSLETITMNHNRLTDTADDAFKGVEHLKRLQLNDNSLVTLKNCTFSRLQSLEQFYFTDNLLTCDCDLLWLSGFLESITQRVGTREDVKPIAPDQCLYPSKWEGALLVNMVRENCRSVTPKSCLGLRLNLEGANVTWSWGESGTGATVTSYSQLNVKTGEIINHELLNSGENMFRLKQLEQDKIYKICVNATQGNSKQTQCIIWPSEIIKPTHPPPTQPTTEKSSGLSPAAGAAVALTVILIIIIILLVLIGVYLYKTKKYKLLIPDRYSRTNSSDHTESSQASPNTNGKTEPLDFRPAEEEPMMEQPPYTEHDL